jgi:hypothetical protein
MNEKHCEGRKAECPAVEVDFETVCGHEAAHAVMRRLIHLPCTAITANKHGGHCRGTGESCTDYQALMVTLAGYAYEAGCGLWEFDAGESRTEDFDFARKLIAERPNFRLSDSGDFESVERSLNRHLKRAGEMLFPYLGYVEHLGARLASARKLSARRVAAVLRSMAR